MAADEVGGLPCGWQIHNKDGEPMAEPAHPPLAVDKVRHVGDQVAIVIAETRDAARDASELIEVDYTVLDAVTDMDTALGGGTLVHDDVPNNRCFDWEIGDKDAVEEAFSKADKVVSIDLANNRLIPNAMEPRAAISDFDRTTGRYTLYTTTQNPHVIRLLMGAFVLQIPEHKLRVVAPDVGGGFGSKIFHYAEEAILTWAAAKVNRPIKWTAERTESFMTDAHGRDHETHAELALDGDGKFLGLRVATKGQSGCLPVDLRVERADLSLRNAAGRRLHDPGDLRRGADGLHEHGSGGRLSRRRTAGVHLPPRTAGHQGRA